nr:hypothetical protein [uncultured Actinoplanes sp.]
MVLPIARPALITLTILSFSGSWNEFPHSLVAVQNPALFALPRGLADLVSGSLGRARSTHSSWARRCSPPAEGGERG